MNTTKELLSLIDSMCDSIDRSTSIFLERLDHLSKYPKSKNIIEVKKWEFELSLLEGNLKEAELKTKRLATLSIKYA